MAFLVRKIEHVGTTFGGKIKALRHDRRLTVVEAAEISHLHPKIILAMEADDFSRLPDPIYSRNLLRNYLRALGGNESYFLTCFEDASGSCNLSDRMVLPRQKVRREHFFVTPRIVKFAGLACVACLVLIYLGIEIRHIVVAPTVEISGPIDGLTTDSAIVSVTGKVIDQADVRVNGSMIILNQDGTFSADVDLDRGLNVITVEAKKRYSQTSIIQRRVVLESTPQNLSANPIEFGP